MVKNFDWKIKVFDITGIWLIVFHIKTFWVCFFFFSVELLNTMEIYIVFLLISVCFRNETFFLKCK